MMTTLQAGTIHHRNDLLRAGWSPTEVAASLRSGRLSRVAPGTYVAGPRASGPSAIDRITAVAQRSPGLIVSYRSAGILHGLPVADKATAPVHLTRPGRSSGRFQQHRILHVGRLPDDQVTVLGGLRVTTVARTLLDLCRTESFVRAVALADHVLHHKMCTDEEILRVLAEQLRAPGAAGARRALAFADGRAESPGESWTRVMFHRCGLGIPELQVTVAGESGTFLGRVDCADLDDNCLYEYDGRVKYEDPRFTDRTETLLAEKRREDRIREAGHALVRFTSADSEPATFADKVLRGRRMGLRSADSGAVTGRLTPAAPIRLPITLDRRRTRPKI